MANDRMNAELQALWETGELVGYEVRIKVARKNEWRNVTHVYKVDSYFTVDKEILNSCIWTLEYVTEYRKPKK